MSINKAEVFNNCLDLVNEQIEKYQETLDGISGKSEDFKRAPDYDEHGNKGEILTNFEKTAGFLDNAQKMKEKLANLEQHHRSEIVIEGSIVETDSKYYYISVPLGEIDMDSGSVIFAISTDAPVYQEMEGKRVGDSFTFNGKKTEIVGIY